MTTNSQADSLVPQWLTLSSIACSMNSFRVPMPEMREILGSDDIFKVCGDDRPAVEVLRRDQIATLCEQYPEVLALARR